MPSLAAEVASAGEGVVGGVVACRVRTEAEADVGFIIIELVIAVDVVAGWLGFSAVGVASTIEGGVGNGAGVRVEDAGNALAGSLVGGEVVEEVGLVLRPSCYLGAMRPLMSTFTSLLPYLYDRAAYSRLPDSLRT